LTEQGQSRSSDPSEGKKAERAKATYYAVAAEVKGECNAGSICLCELPADSDHDLDSTIDKILEHTVVSAFAAKTSKSKLSVTQAVSGEEADDWKLAIISEVTDAASDSCARENRHPRDYHLIHATTQLKKKMKTAEIVEKFKARLCACGNELAGLIRDTFSPTVSSLAHSVLHQLAVCDDMEMCLIDTVAAYLNQDYPDDATPLYLKLPRVVAEVCGPDPNIIYRLKKYIYGLPDAGRASYLAYREHLIKCGFAWMTLL
jgi:hypothetical protein